jgi:hypothetical protein
MPQHFRPSLDPGLWARAREVEQDGVHFFLMSPEDRLLLLCWHFLADFLQPEKLRDVRLVLEHGDTLRWDEVGRRAEEQGLTVTLHLVCALAAGGMERPLPAAWLQAVPPAARLRLRSLLSLRRRVRGRVTILAHPFLMIAAYDRWPAMLPRLREAFLPSRFDVAYTYLGHWPSMREYLLTLARIYLQGTAKQIARYRRARSS